jgi:hypothetical protein
MAQREENLSHKSESGIWWSAFKCIIPVLLRRISPSDATHDAIKVNVIATGSKSRSETLRCCKINIEM